MEYIINLKSFIDGRIIGTSDLFTFAVKVILCILGVIHPLLSVLSNLIQFLTLITSMTNWLILFLRSNFRVIHSITICKVEYGVKFYDTLFESIYLKK